MGYILISIVTFINKIASIKQKCTFICVKISACSTWTPGNDSSNVRLFLSRISLIIEINNKTFKEQFPVKDTLLSRIFGYFRTNFPFSLGSAIQTGTSLHLSFILSGVYWAMGFAGYYFSFLSCPLIALTS